MTGANDVFYKLIKAQIKQNDNNREQIIKVNITLEELLQSPSLNYGLKTVHAQFLHRATMLLTEPLTVIKG